MTYTSGSQVDAAFARLLSRSYGPPPAPARRTPARAVTLSSDSGTEVVGTADPVFEEYVVERGEPPVAGAGVPSAESPSAEAPSTEAPATSPLPGPAPADDVVPAFAPTGPTDQPDPASRPGPTAQPDPVLAGAPAPPAPASGVGEPSASPSPTQRADDTAAAPAPPAGAPTAAPADPYAAATAPSATAPSAPSGTEPAASAPALSGDDLASDMQAILTGQKVYDPSTGGMRDRSPSPPPPEPPIAAKNEQEIFDRIAESMAYANAFDLGTVELKRRFDTFDRAGAQRSAPAASSAAAPPAPAAAPPAPAAAPGQREFIQDLSVIDDTRAVAQAVLAVPFWSALRTSTEPGATVPLGTIGRLSRADFSRPFFDTGEHVRAGDDVAVVPLPVNTVTFSYGDIIAMPDFFENPEDLLAASARELEALRGHIRRSAEYYRARRGTNPVTNADWTAATGGRYLTLAEDNYSHFAPTSLLQLSYAQQRTDNRARYAQLHQQALRESQNLHLAHPQATPTLESALVINAFADHFLTDAFASGHLVNKEYIIDLFRTNFYRGAALTDDANAFFDRVARQAFTGDLAQRFSRLEQASPTIGIGDIGWHANIDSADRFATLLKRAAEQEPGKIANVAVKVLHDHLNSSGVTVTNGAGAAPWLLYGDEALDDATLRVMRQAVAQSVANLSDPSLLADGVDLGAFVDRVWRFTPVPTAASLTQLRTDVQTYSTPASTVFSDATAALIRAHYLELVDELKSGGHLREA